MSKVLYKNRKRIEDVIEPHARNRKSAPLSETHPHLSAEWLYSKNCGFGPEDFSHGSGISVWWRCPADSEHIWQAPITIRTSGHGCPVCADKVVTPENCLANRNPDIAKEWNQKKNSNLKPQDVNAGARLVVWWRCSACQHQWKTSLHNRTSGQSGCPKCVRNVIDLTADKYRYCLEFFDAQKNKDVNPSWVPSKQILHWKCPVDKHHLWERKVLKTVPKLGFCPFCARTRTSTYQIEKIKNLHARGLTYPAIAQSVGVDKTTVWKFLKQEGLI